jgi:hypothetical protein
MLTQLVSSARTNNDQDQIQLNDKHCYRFLHEHLRKLNEKQHQLKQQLTITKKQFYAYTNAKEDILQTFIRNQSKALRLEYKHDMKKIEFDYRQRVLDHTFEQKNASRQKVINTSSSFLLLKLVF